MSVVYNMTAKDLEGRGFRAIHAGDDYDHGFTYTRGGAVQDLTSATLWLTVKESSTLTDGQAKLQLTSPTKIEITDAAAGEFTVHFYDTDTEGLEGEWPYDIKVKMASGAIIRIARGVIEFLPNITRAII